LAFKRDLTVRRDQLDGVVAFLRVAERRSFTAAAAELGVTPAAVSHTIKQLEARTGVALFARTTRDVGLTEAGRRFLDHARPGLAQLTEAFEAARRLGNTPSGLLRLNVPRVALPGLVQPLLAEFCTAHPGVEVEIAVEDRNINIVEEGFDAGIRLGELLEADMVAIRLTPPLRCAIVAAPAYLERRGRPRRPEELRGHACINFRQGRGTLYRWEFEENGREWEMAVPGTVSTNDGALMISAAMQGLGLAYTIGPTVAPLVEAGVLESVLEPFMPETPGFFLYFPSRAQVLPKLRAFADFAVAKLRGR
jgi:DNA-binding transcriptional LysR family regulator